MAYGDPMVFETENLTAYGGFETDGGSGIATGWAAANSGAEVTAQTDSIDSGYHTGTKAQKLLMTTSGTGWRQYYLTINVPGPTNQDGNGHLGAKIRLTIYAKRGSAMSQTLALVVEEQDSSGAAGTTHTGTANALTDSYAQYTYEFDITDTDCAKLKVMLRCGVTGAQTDADFWLDTFTITEKLTCNTNPTSESSTYGMPEAFERSINNTGYFQRNSSSVPKHTTGRLTFHDTWAYIKLLRSLWLWGKLITWTPYLYNLPATMYVYFTGDCTPRRLAQNDSLFELSINFQEQ